MKILDYFNKVIVQPGEYTITYKQFLAIRVNKKTTFRREVGDDEVWSTASGAVEVYLSTATTGYKTTRISLMHLEQMKPKVHYRLLK